MSDSRTQRLSLRNWTDSVELDPVLEHVSDAIVVLRLRDGVIVAVNPAFTSLTGWKPKAVIGSTPDVLRAPHTPPRVMARFRRAFRTRRPLHLETVIKVCHDGPDRFHIHMHIDHDLGRAVVVLSPNLSLVRMSEMERSHIAIAASRNGVWEWNVLTGHMHLCARARALLELPDDIASTDPDIALAHLYPTDRIALLSRIQSHIDAHDAAFEHTVRVRRNETNDARWLMVRGALLRETASQPARIIGTMTDITVQKIAENALIDSEQRFSDVICAADEYVWESDAHGTITFVSNRIASMKGFSVEEIIGRPLTDFIDKTDELMVARALDKAVHHNRRIIGLEYKGLHKSGKLVCERMNCLPITDGQGDVIGFRGVTMNITEQKMRLEALIAAKKMTEHSNKAKTVFLARMSHELRTPLNAILGFSEIMADDVLDHDASIERYAGYARHIQASGHHLLGLIDDVLEVARLETANHDIERTILEIEPLIRAAVERHNRHKTGDLFIIKIKLGSPPARLHADPDALNHMLDNLLSNAIKFAPAGAHISINAYLRGNGNVAIAVIDNGSGIPHEQIDRILQPFEQGGEDGALSSPGVGLGLTMVKGLIELHGGGFEIESTPGQGTTATLVFPPASE